MSQRVPILPLNAITSLQISSLQEKLKKHVDKDAESNGSSVLTKKPLAPSAKTRQTQRQRILDAEKQTIKQFLILIDVYVQQIEQLRKVQVAASQSFSNKTNSPTSTSTSSSMDSDSDDEDYDESPASAPTSLAHAIDDSIFGSPPLSPRMEHIDQALELARLIQKLVLPHHRTLCQALESTESDNLQSIVESFVSGYLEKDLSSYLENYAADVPALQVLILEYQQIGDAAPYNKASRSFAALLQRLDAQYQSHNTEKGGISFISLLREPLELLEQYPRKLEQLGYSSLAERVQNLIGQQKQLLDRCKQQDRKFTIKLQLQLPAHLGDLAGEGFHDALGGPSETPRFLHELRLYRVKLLENNEQQKSIRVKKLVGPCEAYVFEKMIVVSWIAAGGKRKKQLLHLLDGMHAEPISTSEIPANGFIIKDLSDSIVSAFKTLNANDFRIVMDQLEQMLSKEVRESTAQVVSAMNREFAQLPPINSVSEMASYYTVPLDQLYKDSKRWTRFLSPDSSSNIEYQDGEQAQSTSSSGFPSRRTLRAATLEKLVEKCTAPDAIDHENSPMIAFLLTYRNILEPLELLELLIDRFNTPPIILPYVEGKPLRQDLSKEQIRAFLTKFLFPVRLKIVLFLQHWIQKHRYDFRVLDLDAVKFGYKFISREQSLLQLQERQKLVQRMTSFINSIKQQQFMRVAAESLSGLLDVAATNKDEKIKTTYLQKLNALKTSIANPESSTARPHRSSFFGLLTLGRGKKSRSKTVMTTSASAPVSPQKQALVSPLQVVQALGAQSTATIELPSSLPVSFDLRSLPSSGILDWTSLEIARQLTLFEFSIFERIEPRELTDQVWNKDAARSPHVCAMISCTNNLSNILSFEILRKEKPKERARVLGKLIKVALELRRLNNFNATFGIASVLTSLAIGRLRSSWCLVKSGIQEDFKQTIQELCSPRRNFKSMRQAIASTPPPLLPYLGLTLTDLTFVDDGNQNIVNDCMLNFFKRQKMSAVIQQLQAVQRAQYSQLVVQPHLQQLLSDYMLQNKLNITTDQLNKLSIQVEPLAATS